MLRANLLPVGVAAALMLTAASLAAQGGYKVPHTPWGDPDLQGKWPGIELVGVPMQRDEVYGTRNVLTDEEFARRQARAAQQAAQDAADFDLDRAAKTPGGAVGGPV